MSCGIAHRSLSSLSGLSCLFFPLVVSAFSLTLGGREGTGADCLLRDTASQNRPSRSMGSGGDLGGGAGSGGAGVSGSVWGKRQCY